MKDIPVVEGLLNLKILVYDKDFVDGDITGELARRSIQKHEITAQLLRYKNPICYVSSINAVYQYSCCPTCDIFFRKTFNMERQLTICSERVMKSFPRNIYQAQGTLFDKLDSFAIKYLSEQKVSEKMAVIDFESNIVQKETFRDTNTSTWLMQIVPIHASIYLNINFEPNFSCNSALHPFVESFMGFIEVLDSQSKAKSRSFFHDIETTMKTLLGSSLRRLSQRHNRQEQVKSFDKNQDKCENKYCATTHFLQIPKNQSIGLLEQLERFSIALHEFGFNSANYDSSLIKFSLLPILVNKRDLEHTVVKKTNKLISFKFCDIQLLDILYFPHSILKA